MKKLQIRPIIITIILLIIQTTMYMCSKLLQSNPSLIGNSLDELIPFNAFFIIFYCSWYIMLFLVPYDYYKKDKTLYAKYTLSFTLVCIISNIIFIIFPTTVNRPIIENTNILNTLTNFIYTLDTPAINCFPSIHSAISFLWILMSLSNKKISKT